MTSIPGKIAIGLATCRYSFSSMRTQWSQERIKAVQNTKLRKLTKYSYDNIKYYRELFDKINLKPDDINTVEDLRNIPITTKQVIKERFWDFLPTQLGPCRLSRTSGSTGMPLCVLSDNNSRIHNSTAVIRYRLAHNISPFGGDILTPLKRSIEPRKLPHWTYLQGLHKTYYVNPYTEQNSEIKYSIKIMNKLKHPAIIGITPAIRALANTIKDGILPTLRPSVVITTGECLTSQVRSLLEEVFATRVADVYACNEAGDIAWQCTKGNSYHINADNCIVEIIKDDQPVEAGQIGEVVITNLNRYSMPFIRYKNGDMARSGIGYCKCGRKLPLISEIIGRSGEDIVLQGGKKVAWNVLKGAMNHNQIRQFQIVQNKEGSVVVKYVPEPKAQTADIEELLRFRFSSLLPPSVSLDFEKVQKIETAASGKSKLVISDYISQ